MNEISLKSKVFSGLFWKFGERFLAQIVSFVVSVILARFLAPNDYGIVSLVLVFISLADVFVTSGFAVALIQKKDSDDCDFSTMFYCSLISSFIIYIVIYIFAPYIADFYNQKILVDVLRIFSLKIPLSVYNTIQHAYVSRHMMFKRFFFSTFFGTLFSGVVGIIMAFSGFGVWALVAQYFTNTIIDTIILSITVPWHPKLLFSFSSAKSLMNYGSKILCADLIGTFFNQLRNFVIGKVYTTSELAFYNKGQQLPSLISVNVCTSITSVLFPAISDVNDDICQVKHIAKRSFQTLSFIMFPMLAGLIVVAEPLILFLYTDKWSFSIYFVQVLSISFAIGMVSTTSLQIIKAIGKSDIILKLEFLKKPIYIVLLFIGVWKGIKAVALTMIVNELIEAIINMFQLKKYINYNLTEQINDMLMPIVMTAVMAFIVYFIKIPINNYFFVTIIKIIIGCIIYIIETLIFKPHAFQFIKNIFK